MIISWAARFLSEAVQVYNFPQLCSHGYEPNLGSKIPGCNWRCIFEKKNSIADTSAWCCRPRIFLCSINGHLSVNYSASFLMFRLVSVCLALVIVSGAVYTKPNDGETARYKTTPSAHISIIGYSQNKPFTANYWFSLYVVQTMNHLCLCPKLSSQYSIAVTLTPKLGSFPTAPYLTLETLWAIHHIPAPQRLVVQIGSTLLLRHIMTPLYLPTTMPTAVQR